MKPARRAGLLLLLGVGCAPTYHRAERYRYDRPAAEALEADALARCQDPSGPNRTPRRSFVSDGCTLWPDAWFTGTSWQRCCVEHDVAYWCGGAGLRAAADDALQQCVQDEFGSFMGGVMWLGTRTWGGPWVPAYWRWGYGNDYPSD